MNYAIDVTKRNLLLSILNLWIFDELLIELLEILYKCHSLIFLQLHYTSILSSVKSQKFGIVKTWWGVAVNQ